MSHQFLPQISLTHKQRVDPLSKPLKDVGGRVWLDERVIQSGEHHRAEDGRGVETVADAVPVRILDADLGLVALKRSTAVHRDLDSLSYMQADPRLLLLLAQKQRH